MLRTLTIWRLLAEPLAPLKLGLLCGLIVAGVSIYCLIYNELSGKPESLSESMLWATINVLPWLVAFEFAKRTDTVIGKSAVLAIALLASLVPAGLADPGSLSFELTRRVPALVLLGSVLGPLHSMATKDRADLPVGAELRPLIPSQIKWVSAAGNYVELHGTGRSVIRRSSLASIERELAAQGFVRVHRSALVRRDFIARVRKRDLILRDGTCVRTGARYRGAVCGIFVPPSQKTGRKMVEG